ncbi:MAG: hypothetical protein RL591_525 [Planctomycetota bacterium]
MKLVRSERSPIHALRRLSHAIAFASVSFALTACETTVTTSDGARAAPKPTEAPSAPQGAKPNAMAITFAPKPADTDGNLLPDSLQVTAYLFARPHPSPIFADGAFHFAIYRLGEAGNAEAPGAAPLRTWTFASESVSLARSLALAGPCHEFTLSLLANRGSDALPVESVDLVAWFEPADGSPAVWLRGVRSVQFPRPEGR